MTEVKYRRIARCRLAASALIVLVASIWSIAAVAVPQEVALRLPYLTALSVDENSGVVSFSWGPPLVEGETPPRYRIYRRSAKLTGAPDAWGKPLANTTENKFLDSSAVKGVMYEYAVVREPLPAEQWVQGTVGKRKYVSPLYFLAGSGIPAVIGSSQKNVLILVEDTLADGLSTALQQYRSDLVTEGYNVIIEKVPAAPALSAPGYSSVVLATKELILELNRDVQGGLSHALLVGSIAIPFSGFTKSQKGEKRAEPADLYYGDTSSLSWSDQGGPKQPGLVGTGGGNYPGDGKFDFTHRKVVKDDLSLVPSFAPEIAVGRVLLEDPNSLTTKAALSAEDRMDRYLDYFTKNHLYRTGQVTAEESALIFDDYLNLEPDQLFLYGRHGTQSFPQLVGFDDTVFARPKGWVKRLAKSPVLLSLGAGRADGDRISGLGTLKAISRRSAQAAFSLFHGEGLGDWSAERSVLRTAIQGRGLASIWAGGESTPPAVFPAHQLATDLTVGEVMLAYQRSHPLAYPVRFNMAPITARIPIASTTIGDPTLRILGEAPALKLKGQVIPENGEIILKISSVGTQDRVIILRSKKAEGPFTHLATLQEGVKEYRDRPADAGAWWYMVRPVVAVRRPGLSFERPGRGSVLTLEVPPTTLTPIPSVSPATSLTPAITPTDGTARPTPTGTQLPTENLTPTPTATVTAIVTATVSAAPTSSTTATNTPLTTVPPTATTVATAKSPTLPPPPPTATAVSTATRTFTPTRTATRTATSTATRTGTSTPTRTSTRTALATGTAVPSNTPVNTPTATPGQDALDGVNYEGLTIQMASPAEGAVVKGDVVLSATATGLPAHHGIEYLIDGKPISGTLSTSAGLAGYPFTIHTVQDFDDGLHRVEAVVRDSRRKIRVRSERSIYISNRNLQRIELLTPTTNPWSGKLNIQFKGPTKGNLDSRAPSYSLQFDGPLGSPWEGLPWKLAYPNDPGRSDILTAEVDTTLIKNGTYNMRLLALGFDTCNCGKRERLGQASYKIQVDNGNKGFWHIRTEFQEVRLKVGETLKLAAPEAVFSDGSKLAIPWTGLEVYRETFGSGAAGRWHFEKPQLSSINAQGLTIGGDSNLARIVNWEPNNRLDPLVNQIETTAIPLTIDQSRNHNGGFAVAWGIVEDSGGWSFSGVGPQSHIVYELQGGVRTLSRYAGLSEGTTNRNPINQGGLPNPRLWLPQAGYGGEPYTMLSRFSRHVNVGGPGRMLWTKFWRSSTAQPEQWSIFQAQEIDQGSQNVAPGYSQHAPTAGGLGVFARSPTTFKEVKLSIVPLQFLDNTSVARISNDGTVTALKKGAATLRIEIGDGRFNELRIVVDNTEGKPHFGFGGKVRYTYDPVGEADGRYRSMIPRGFFVFGGEDLKSTSEVTKLLKYAGFNMLNQDWSDSNYMDSLENFCAGVRRKAAAKTAQLNELGDFGVWANGDGMFWGGILDSKPWADEAIKCVIQAYAESRKVTLYSVQDEVRGFAPPRMQGIANVFRSVPGHPPYDWFVFFNEPPDQAASWYSENLVEMASNEHAGLTSLSRHGDMMLEQFNIGGFLGRQNAILQAQPTKTLPKTGHGNQGGAWYNNFLMKGDPYVLHEGLAASGHHVPPNVFAQFAYGATGVRYYNMGSSEANVYSFAEVQPAFSELGQMDMHPQAYRTQVFHAAASTHALMDVLGRGMFLPQISAVSVGNPRILNYGENYCNLFGQDEGNPWSPVTVPLAKRGDPSAGGLLVGGCSNNTAVGAFGDSANRVLIVANFANRTDTLSINLKPYLFPQGAVVRWRLVGATLSSELIQNVLEDKVEAESGEVLVYQFFSNPSQAVPAVHIITPLSENSVLKELSVKLNIQSSSTITKVEYYLDGDLVRTFNGAPQPSTVSVSHLAPDKWHGFVAKVFSSAGVNQARLAFRREPDRVTGQTYIIDDTETDPQKFELVSSRMEVLIKTPIYCPGFDRLGKPTSPGATPNYHEGACNGYKRSFLGLAAWVPQPGAVGYAEYTFKNLNPGQSYGVYISFGRGNYSKEAPWEILDNGSTIASMKLNLNELNRAWTKTWDPEFYNQGWAFIGRFTPKTNTLKVRSHVPLDFTGPAYEGRNVNIADAVMVRAEQSW